MQRWQRAATAALVRMDPVPRGKTGALIPDDQIVRSRSVQRLLGRSVAVTRVENDAAGYFLAMLGARMEMAPSIEGRVLFLDHHVVETIRSQPCRIRRSLAAIAIPAAATAIGGKQARVSCNASTLCQALDRTPLGSCSS
jgi:hypothetical protein